MRVRKALMGCASIALAVTTLTACGGDDGDGSSNGNEGGGILNQERITIGVRFDQPGLGLDTGGDAPEGFDIEIARIIIEGLGIPEENVTWRETVSANREPFLQNGTVDIVVATYTINEERASVIDFAGPYYVAGQDLLVPVDSDIQGPDDLTSEHIVCSVNGSTPAERIQTDYPDVQLQLFDTYSQCVEQLAAGAVHAVTTDDIILAGYASQEQYAGQFRVVGQPFSEEPYGIGIAEEDTEGCRRINEILAEAIESGAYEEAWNATLGASGTPAPSIEPPDGSWCD